MRKMIVAAAIAAAAVPFTPALADFVGTKWGMNPAQVIAKVKGAVAVTQDSQDDIRGMHMLAQADQNDGGVAVKTRFYFKPDTNGLAMVDQVPTSADTCPSYLAVYTKRYGPGTASSRDQDYNGRTFTFTTTEWQGQADDVSFLDVTVNNGAVHAICKGLVEKR